jgi:tetraacyldisaccharide 4'-kinase
MPLSIKCSFVTMLTELRKFVEARWYGNIGVLAILLPLSWAFALLAKLRRLAYRSGMFKRPELPVPVVVVGNVSVGGTGKTPVVAWLAEELAAAGFRPGIVSRGYGGTPNAVPTLIRGQSADEVGDEPLLLSRLSRSPVCVCRDRVAAVNALAEQGVDVVISDDGLQHYRMRRHVELIVVDGDRGFGNGRLLPAGPLREPVSRMVEADAVLVNGGVGRVAGIKFGLEESNPVELCSNEPRPWVEFTGVRVWCVAGIGNPTRFRTILEARGLSVDMAEVPDHGTADLKKLLELRHQPIFMTEKDAVKYPQPEANIWAVPVTVSFQPADAEKIVATVVSGIGPV